MSDEMNKKDAEDWEDLSWAEQAFYLGYAKYYGVGIEPDRKEGLDLLKQAADLESLDAIVALLCIFENEDDENYNEREAVHWRERQTGPDNNSSLSLCTRHYCAIQVGEEPETATPCISRRMERLAFQGS